MSAELTLLNRVREDLFQVKEALVIGETHQFNLRLALQAEEGYHTAHRVEFIVTPKTKVITDPNELNHFMDLLASQTNGGSYWFKQPFTETSHGSLNLGWVKYGPEKIGKTKRNRIVDWTTKDDLLTNYAETKQIAPQLAFPNYYGPDLTRVIWLRPYPSIDIAKHIAEFERSLLEGTAKFNADLVYLRKFIPQNIFEMLKMGQLDIPTLEPAENSEEQTLKDIDIATDWEMLW